MEERLYDLIFICRPGYAGSGHRQSDRHAGIHRRRKGRQGRESTAKWGRKRMAYRVQKLREGYFVYMVVRSSNGEVVKEIERRLKVADPVIKYLTVRLDEELKRQDKLKRHRERRAARRPRKTVAPALPPAGAPAITGRPRRPRRASGIDATRNRPRAAQCGR